MEERIYVVKVADRTELVKAGTPAGAIKKLMNVMGFESRPAKQDELVHMLTVEKKVVIEDVQPALPAA
jgi:hypothetical protein